MLIREKLPLGHIYPQLSQAPITTYADFLNFFRGGHTIDDNVDAPSVASTTHAAMLRTAITSGHLTKVKCMAIPSEFLVDVSLTKPGSELIQTFFDRKFCEMAIAESRKSVAEDGRLHPSVGVVIVKKGKMLATGYRGESGTGDHGEYCALKKLNETDVQGATVYTTLEPCSTRKPPKQPCTVRLIESKVARVVVVSQVESRDWEADRWLLVTPTRRADSVQPHLRATPAQAILKERGGRFAAWQNLSTD